MVTTKHSVNYGDMIGLLLVGISILMSIGLLTTSQTAPAAGSMVFATAASGTSTTAVQNNALKTTTKTSSISKSIAFQASTTICDLGPGEGDCNSASTGAGYQAVLTTICMIFNTIKSVIFILGLTLMLLGGALYSGANLLPAQQRGSIQGYGMSMIMGGVIGVAIAIAAPFILNVVVSTSPNVSTALQLTSTGVGGYAAQVCSGQATIPGGATPL